MRKGGPLDFQHYADLLLRAPTDERLLKLSEVTIYSIIRLTALWIIAFEMGHSEGYTL